MSFTSQDQEITNSAPGPPTSTKETILHTGASLIQTFAPTKSLCAHLHAFHTPYDAPGSVAISAHHYCAHVNEDVRQCIIYDSDKANARLIGVEYMIKPHLFDTLDAEERKLWHSHVFEVKSGMLVMPAPTGTPQTVWEAAETSEMREVVKLYGKVYHLWGVERGDVLPLGQPRLMTSFSEEGQVDLGELTEERDRELGVDTGRKKEIREGIEVPEVHADVDQAWKGRK